MSWYSIMKREVNSYFTSLTAYIVLLIFLVISGYFFYTNLTMFVTFVGSDVKLGLWQFTFQDMRRTMLLLLPLLTMRLFAEEKKLGTIELLYTHPIKDLAIIMGKYLACLLVLMVMLVLTFLYPILLKIVYSIELGPLVTGYLGLFLLGGAFIACGIFVSSLTENQIVAAMVTAGILILFWSIDWNEGIAGTKAMVVLHQISLFEHFYSFPRGVIDISNIVYYLSITFFFLFLTLLSLESRQWRGKK